MEKVFEKCSEGFGGIIIFKYKMDPQYSLTKRINLWIELGICSKIKDDYFILSLEGLHNWYDYEYSITSFDPFTPNRNAYITRKIIGFLKAIDTIIEINDQTNFHSEQMPEYLKIVNNYEANN